MRQIFFPGQGVGIVVDQALEQDTSSVSASQIVSSAPAIQRLGTTVAGSIIFHPVEQFAPAWFYSALNWLGSSFQDASGTRRSFAYFMIGSDVDPYRTLGSTRLFYVARVPGAGYEMSVAADTASTASLTVTTSYDASDAGILAMYQALAASPVFASVKYCADARRFAPSRSFAAAGLRPSSSPATTRRRASASSSEGSAVAQVVPLHGLHRPAQRAGLRRRSPDRAHRQRPGLRHHPVQRLGATTFSLPVYYAATRSAASTTSTSWRPRRPRTTRPSTAARRPCSRADPVTTTRGPRLTLSGTVDRRHSADGPSPPIRSTRQGASAHPAHPAVDAGVCTLTYSGPPGAIFATSSDRRLLPGAGAGTRALASRSTTTARPTAASPPRPPPLAGPDLIYGKTNEFLNGGSLQNVLQKLLKATYMLSSDRLVAILDAATAVEGTARRCRAQRDDRGARLHDELEPPRSTIVNQLSVPVLATVTTTRRATIQHPRAGGLGSGRQSPPAVPSRRTADGDGSRSSPEPAAVGGQRQHPDHATAAPQTIQVPLTATMPQAALAATGIGSIEIGTAFPVQSIGSAAASRRTAGPCST